VNRAAKMVGSTSSVIPVASVADVDPLHAALAQGPGLLARRCSAQQLAVIWSRTAVERMRALGELDEDSLPCHDRVTRRLPQLDQPLPTLAEGGLT